VGEGEWERVKNKTGVALATMERVAGADKKIPFRLQSEAASGATRGRETGFRTAQPPEASYDLICLVLIRH